jgi:diguanylate cyclase (GGDEF)-like protein
VPLTDEGGRRPRLRRALRVAAGAALACLALFAAHAVLGLGGRALGGWRRDAVYDGVIVIAAGACLARARLVAVERALWLALGGALVAWSGGFLANQAIVQRLDPVPFPSIADVLWLAFYPLAYIGLGLLVRSRLAHFHPSLWLDGLIGTLALASIGAAVVAPRLDFGGLGPAAVATNLAYPLGDLLLLALVVALFALTGWRPGGALALIAVAFAVQVVTDTAYLYKVAEGDFVWGGPLDTGWLMVALLLASAAWQRPRESRRRGGEDTALLAMPAVLTALAVVVLVYCSFTEASPLAAALATGALVLAVARMVLAIREHRRLADLARRDPLTGLLNHGEFHVRVERQIARGERTGTPFSVTVFDLDGFKRLNDVEGHAEGDRLLREVAAEIRRNSQASDAACRVGGDEFGLVLPGVAPAEAQGVAERVVRGVRALTDRIDISYGVASWPDDGSDKDALLLRADVGLYAAKQAGEQPLTNDDATTEYATERELERAQLKAYAEDVRRSYARELSRAQELSETYLATVQTLAAAVEAKDDYTGGHIQRVLRLGLLLARAVAPEDAEDSQLAYGFLLHDIGKLAVPDAVLTKPGKLNEEEWDLMRGHPAAGARILGGIPFLTRALDVVLHHHERWDGRGYPHGLAGEQIPLWARIFAVVDTVDAITSDRPYRAGQPLAVAVEEVLRGTGTQFCPRVGRAFAELDPAEVEALLEPHDFDEHAAPASVGAARGPLLAAANGRRS